MAIEVVAEVRTEKNPRELRRRGYIPGVVYGAGVHRQVQFHWKTLQRALAQATRSSRFTIQLEGETYPTFLREIQYHPLNDAILHVDFYRPRPGQPVTLEVPILLHGSPVGLKMGGTLSQVRDRLPVRGPMEHVPPAIEVDVTPMEVGSVLRVGDLDLSGVSVLVPLDSTIAFVRVPRRVEAVEAVEEAEEAEAAPAEAAAEEAAQEAAQEAEEKTDES